MPVGLVRQVNRFVPPTWTLLAEERRLIHAYLDQVRYLATDFSCWSGLMPHIHDVDILDRRENRTLVRVNARRGWFPVTFECGISHDREHLTMQRWYRGPLWGGIVETWRLKPEESGEVTVICRIVARGWQKRLAARLIIEPIAEQQIEMIDLLATAHRQSHDALDW